MVFFLPNKELFTVRHAHQCMTKLPKRERDEIFNYNDFVECTINKKSHNLFVQLASNGYP